MQPLILEENLDEPKRHETSQNPVDIEKYLSEQLKSGDSEEVQKFICTVAMKLVLADYQLASDLTDVKETNKPLLLGQACPVCVFNSFCKHSKTAGANRFWSP